MIKYYQDLAKYGAFSLKDASKVMCNSSSASKQLNTMIKNGLVKRIKQDLYTCTDLVNGGYIANRYVIASHINETTFVSYHSAFEFYGFYNQVFNEVQVCSKRRFANFEDSENSYRCFLSSIDKQIEIIKGVKVTSIERTIIDSINMLGKVMDVEELIKCLELVHIVDQNKLMEMLNAYNKEILFRKVGYILSSFKNQYRLDDGFFEYCKKNSDFSYRGEISGNEINKLTYIKEWSLYGYTNLLDLKNKGGNVDV